MLAYMAPTRHAAGGCLIHPAEQAVAKSEPRVMTGGAALQVDASAIRDLQDASQIDGYTLPKLYRSAGRF